MEKTPSKVSRRTPVISMVGSVIIALLIAVLLFWLFRYLGNLTQPTDNTGTPQQAQLDAIQSELNNLKLRVTQATSANDTTPNSSLQGSSETSASQGAPSVQGPVGPQGPPGPSGTASCPNGPCASLQSTTPGVQETGNFNISGGAVFGGDISAGDITASGTISGDGSGLTNVDAATLGGYSVGNNANQIPLNNGTLNTDLNADLLDGQHGSFYQNADNLTAGTLGDARLSANVVLQNAANVFTAPTNTFQGIAATNLLQGGNQVCDISNNCNYAPGSGSGNYIQNGTSAQTANFNITGNGYFGGNVGIGTTNPLNPLQILSNGGADVSIGNIASSYGAIGFSDAALSTSNYALAGNGAGETILQGGTGGIGFRNGAGDLMRLTQSGRLGIGVAAPNSPLDVLGGANNGYVARLQNPTLGGYGLLIQTSRNNSSDVGLAINDLFSVTTDGRVNATNLIATNTITGASLLQGGNQVCDISNNCNYAPGSGSANYIQNGTSLQTANFNITGNGYFGGNVGIGTTTPNYKLEVGGSALFSTISGSTVVHLNARSSANQSTLRFQEDGTRAADITFGNSTHASLANQLRIVNATSTGSLVLGTNDSSRLTILSDGNTGVGTTTPGARLEVVASNDRAAIFNSGIMSGNGNIVDIQGSLTRSSTASTYGAALNIGATISPTSGTSNLSFIDINGTINQTATGITRGLYVRPTITAAPNFRGVEIANNTGFGLYQSGANALNYFAGNVGIGMSNPSAKLNVLGDTQFYAFGATAMGGLTNWLRSDQGTVTVVVGMNGSTNGLGANVSSGNIRFSGRDVASGDFGYYPTGGGAGNYGTFRFSNSGNAIATTPNAKIGVGQLYSAGSVAIGTTSPSYLLDVQGGTGIVGQFSGRVIGGDAANANEFVTLGQLNGAAGNYIQNGTSAQTANFNITGNGIFGGNVGIGATPVSKLTVGEYTDTAQSLTFGDDSSAQYYGISAFDNKLKFASPGGFRFVTNSNTTPQDALTIYESGGVFGVGINNAVAPNMLSVNSLSTANTTAQVAIGTNGTGNKGLVIQGTSGQSANLQEWQDSTGSSVAAVTSGGTIISTDMRTGGIVDTTQAGPYLTFGSDALTLITRQAANTGLAIRGASGQVASLLLLQDASGVALAQIDASGNLSVKSAMVEGDLSVTGSITTGNITVNGHIITGNTSGSTTAAAGSDSGLGASVSINGNDTSGTITITTGTGVSAGQLATVTFANAYGTNPSVVITPKDIPGGAIFPQYHYTSTTGGFELKSFNALTDSVTYTFSYFTAQ